MKNEQPELGADLETMNRRARENRETRARNAGTAVLHYLWPQLAPEQPPHNTDPADLLVDFRWYVRGEPRTRETFGLPHPGDFPGGLPIPREYPSAISAAISRDPPRTPRQHPPDTLR